MKHPNILLIFMDDLTHWAVTDPACATPSIDRLRARGTTFTHAFNQGSYTPAVCLPAREMLLSGRYLHHVQHDLPNVPRLGPTLHDAGYLTCFTGKWHNEHELLAADYDFVGPFAGEGMLISTGSAAAGTDPYHRPSDGNHWTPDDTSLGGHWLPTPDGGVEHSSTRWTDAAIGMLEAHVGDAPFFLHVAYNAPHDPRQAPSEYVVMYPPQRVAVPPNAWPQHPFDNGELTVRDEQLAPFPRTREAVQLHRAEYQAIVTHADHEIGRLLDRLDASPAAASTIVVLSGDHGLALGEHGLIGKQNSYDHSTRVPLVIAGPGIPAGQVHDGLVYSGSIFATLCELAEVPIPASVEFESLVPEIRDAADGLDELYGAYRDDQRWLRTREHKLIDYPGHGRTQLFDLVRDPWEMHDLHEQEPALASDLTARLAEARRMYGDPMLNPLDLASSIAPIDPERAVFGVDGYDVWGGSPIADPDGDGFWLFYARWPRGDVGRDHEADGTLFDGFSGWMKHSEIAVAHSDSPYGPYRHVRTILRGTGDPSRWDRYNAHNPHVRRFHDKYYLYFIATDPDNAPETADTPWRRFHGGQRIGVVVADSLAELVAGDGIRSDQPLLAPDDVHTFQMAVNPSVTRMPSGEYLMTYKAWSAPATEHYITVTATAPTPEGPFTYWRTALDGELQAEDPYLWYDRSRRRYFAIVKDFSPGDDRSRTLTEQFGALALIQSSDGANWARSPKPLVSLRRLRLTDGRTVELQRLERPQLLFDGEGAPIALNVAAAFADPDDEPTVNITIPLRVSRS